jgi:hypothetical protein
MTDRLTPTMFSIDSNPYGLTYGEWTARWWQWAYSMGKARNPINDNTGENSGLNQNYSEVWFLAGTFGGSVERTCTIPSTKAILLPNVNFAATFADEPDVKTTPELIAKAKHEMDEVSEMHVSVDGITLKDLQNYRVQSPLFDVTLPEDSIFGGKAGPTQGISDGYWVFLHPLSAGEHEIRSTGSCLAGKVNIGVTYHLIVKE